ncbi:MAG: VCBS repeat-containing protein [bacterium]|nr:VCBS repeat-containing protein [bacterium]
MLATIRNASAGMLLVALIGVAPAQTFVRVTDPQNEAAVTPGTNGYRGCAWIDHDQDGDEDLWVNRNLLYRNDGNGVFVNTHVAITAQNGLGSGGSWADYDNDGDPDLYISDSPRSALYRNDGNELFTQIDEGDIGATGHDYRGWSCAWGDYDSDGNVDLIITHPAGFLGNPAIPNFMFRNDGPPNYTFTRVTDSDVVTGLGAYTIGSFADFDLDGDLDFNIGSGPVSAPGVDYFYRNTFAQTGVAELVRWTGNNLTETPRDGQNINWIDYDNDGDLDCYITNYTAGFSNGRANDLYRNDGGVYVQITAGAIVTDRQVSLGNCWADFDNDGWLDCVVANESGTNKYYRNLGDGTFESLTTPFTVAGSFRCPASADYDNDGDLDLFITANGAAQGFYRNDLETGNFWSKFKLLGTESNRTAIGAVVRIKCLIGDDYVWQMREVNAQNSFCGHNSFAVHFGVLYAPQVDSVIIHWPSGLVETYTGLYVNQLYEFVEGAITTAEPTPPIATTHSLAAYPNPFNGAATIHYQLASNQTGRIEIRDVLGRLVLQYDQLAATGSVRFAPEGLASGTYLVALLDVQGRNTAPPFRLYYLK